MFGIPKEIKIELIWYLCLHYSSLIPSEAWLVADWMFVGGSVHSVQLELYGDRWWMAAICCQILISDQHTSHRLHPCDITLSTDLPNHSKYTPTLKWSRHLPLSIAQQHDRNGKTAPAPEQTSELASLPVQCKAVPSQAAAQGHVWW